MRQKILSIGLILTVIISALSFSGCKADPNLYKDSEASVEDRIESLLSQMTLEEKVAQMMQPEHDDITLEQVTQYGIGSILSGGGSDPSTGNALENWQEMVNNYKQAALDSRLGIPLLYGIDAVHGHNNVLDATMFPHNIGLGAANNPELMEEIGKIVASEVRATGIQWTFAPTLANAQSEFWGRTYESFSESVEDVVNLSGPYIKGMQGGSDINSDSFMTEYNIIACAKHFIGEGYTVNGQNQGDVSMTEEEFDALLESGVLNPYTNAVNENVLTVMASYNSVNGVKCHENYHLLTEVLKEDLGFKGLVVSDYMGVQQVSGKTYKDQIELCVNAGIDLFMEPESWKECMDLLIELVNEGRVKEERIDDAVSRILWVKFTAGLFEEEINGAAEKECVKTFGSKEHRDVARQAVRESLVLVKNEQVNGTTAINALKGAKNISVVGSKADDIGSQCGGWTITWEGHTGNFTEGTSIIDGLKEVAGSDVKFDFNKEGKIKKNTDAVIVVVGENPYVETGGDRYPASLGMTYDDKLILEELGYSLDALDSKDDIPVIAVILSGRPINLSDYIDSFDGLVMAWLPGSEGAGIADVLLGDYDFKGTLKFTWVKDPYDISTKFEKGSEAKILYPYGYGLNKNGDTISQ